MNTVLCCILPRRLLQTKCSLININVCKCPCTIKERCLSNTGMKEPDAVVTTNLIENEDADKNAICTFGVLTDVHYADIQDGTNYSKTRRRYYRKSLSLVEAALSEWRRSTHILSFILQLGDLVDEHNVIFGKETIEAALRKVLTVFSTAPAPVYHVWGNHDFYNFTRSYLLASPEMNARTVHLSAGTPAEVELSAKNFFKSTCPASESAAYFHFSPTKGYRIVVLDQYEVSMLGLPSSCAEYQLAQEMLQQQNRNSDLNSPLGLRGLNARFVQFNGAVSTTQLEWLRDVLNEAQMNEEIVLVAGNLSVWARAFADYRFLMHDIYVVISYFKPHSLESGQFTGFFEWVFFLLCRSSSGLR